MGERAFHPAQPACLPERSADILWGLINFDQPPCPSSFGYVGWASLKLIQKSPNNRSKKPSKIEASLRTDHGESRDLN